MKILCFGSLGIDYSYWIPKYIKPGEEISASRFERLPGGRGLKQAISIARSGEEVYFAGCIGTDGLFLKEFLEESGVNTRHLKISSGVQSHAVKQRYGDNEYSIISFGETNSMIDEAYIDEVLSCFDAGDIILLQNEINNTNYIVEKAFSRSMRVILNPSPFNENLRLVDLSKIDTLILSEQEALSLFGAADIGEICDCIKEKYNLLKIVITLGAIGGIYFDSQAEFHFQSYSEASESVFSSGDSFVGYYVSGVKKGLSIEKNLKRASCASALVVISRINNMLPSVPCFVEVEKSLLTLKPNSKGTFATEKRRKLVLMYIDNNFAKPSLSELAKIMGYSKSYTTIWIQKNMNTSFSDMIKDKRCEKAAELLRETDISIENVIRQTGCENGSFFRRIFKEKYGKNLLEYRNSSTEKR